jgi:hypothetical protein
MNYKVEEIHGVSGDTIRYSVMVEDISFEEKESLLQVIKPQYDEWLEVVKHSRQKLYAP